jgi:hypothetical protein
MTDDKIKEEFENWIKGVTTQEEADFANRFHPYYMDLAQGYISGFRAAERLADVLNLIKPEGKDWEYRAVDDLVYDWVITD